MKCSAWLSGLFALLSIASIPVGSAHAQTFARTFVSANGSDGNNCTQSSPCYSFSTAITKTAPGGEINCTGANGDTGYFSINKSVTIDCGGMFGGITVSGGRTGITINAGPSDRVILRNININGFGTAYGGVNFASGAQLELDNVKIEGMSIAGISASRSTLGVVVVKNSTFSKMPTGIKLETSSANIILSVTDSNFNYLSLNGVEAGSNVFAGVYNSTFTALNGTAIQAASATSTVYAESNVIQNTWFGISANVAGAKINATRNTFYGNSKAFNVASGATFLSGGDNKIDVNPGNAPTGALATR